MPEIQFKIQWPNGSEETCYSPSLIVKEYFTPDTDYALSDFVERSRTALIIASDRVKAKYGFSCSLALGQLDRITSTAARCAPDSTVRFVRFLD